MNTLTPLHRAARTCAGAALAATLVACGGGYEDDYGQPLDLFASARPAALPPLLDNDGRAHPPLPAAMPERGDQFTRSGLYALRAQAEALDRALGGRVVWLDADCCHGNDTVFAEGLVAGMAAALDLRADTPVFVAGDDLRHAAAVVDRLGQQGYSRVFLVTR